MKKVFYLVLITLSMMFFISFSLVKADTVLTTHITRIGEVEEEILDGGVIFNHQVLSTYYKDPYLKANRDVLSYTIPGDNEEVKMATWSYSNPHGYQNNTLDKIAEDYEKKHPGWIVIGGVNAEGYYEGEITNAFIQDGDVIRKDVSMEAFKELIGFYPDRSYVIKRLPEVSANPFLKILKDDGTYNSFIVNKVNQLPSGNEIALLTKDLAASLDLSGYTTIKANYSLMRKSTKFPDLVLTGNNYGIFVKGVVDNVQSLNMIDNVATGSCYIVTKNSEVIALMKPDTIFKCEYDYLDEFAEVESMTGYMFKLLINNEVVTESYYEDLSSYYKAGLTPYDQSFTYSQHAYYSAKKDRTAIGFKDDGSIVLLTASTPKVNGPSQYEVGEILKTMGCSNAYQFDSGGSVSFIKRSELGKMEMLNTSSDGSARALSTGLFIVMRDPGLSTCNYTRSTITCQMNSLLYNDTISSVKVHIDNQEYAVDKETNNWQYVVEGLKENTDYDVYFTYQVDALTNKNKTVNGRTRTYHVKTSSFILPPSGLMVNNKTDTTLEIIKKPYTQAPNIRNVIVHVGDNIYNMGNEDTLLITDLIIDTEYEVYFEYDVYDELTGNLYKGTDETIFVKTSSFKIPTVDELVLYKQVNNQYTFKYLYNDYDDVVTKAYLLVTTDDNEISYEVTKKRGTYEVSNIDLTVSSCQVSFVIEYINDDWDLVKVNSNVLTYDKIEVTPDPDPDPEPDPDPDPDPDPEPDPEPDPDPIVNPEPITKKGCKKKSIDILFIVGQLTMLLYILKKRK